MRDAAYGMLLREPRRVLHTRIAEAIARLRPEVAKREAHVLAWHHTRAGLAEPAIGYWRRAAEGSAAQFANREASDYFQRALDLIEILPPSAGRDRLEADLRLAQAVPLIAVHGFGSEAVEACAARAKELGDHLLDWPGAFAARKLVWNSSVLRQSLRRAVALARDLLSLAARGGDPAQIAIACRALGISLFEYGKPAEADPVLARGVALADSVADTEFALYGEDPRIVCRLHWGQARCLIGYPETALRLVGEGLARARASNNPHAVAWSLVYLAQIHIFRRDAAAAEKAGAEAIDIARQHRFAQWLAFAQERRGWALCQLGDADQGLALLEEAVQQHHGYGAFTITRPFYYLAAGCFLAGRPEAALGHIETAHRNAEADGEHHLSAEIHRLHAEVLRVQDAPTPEIERHLRTALKMARRQEARLWELRAATSLARLWQAKGRAAEAHELLAPLYASFTEGFGLPDLVEARALLSQ